MRTRVGTLELADWIESHNHAFAAIGGVAALLVPDNTKVAVIKACLYDPVVNRTYAELAAHDGTVGLPARPYKPRDKAKVEAGVLIAERWQLGRLRNKTFHSLAELNAAIAEFCRRLNDERVIRRVNQTRRQMLEELDRPALKPCRRRPTCWPSGGFAGSGSTTTSRRRTTSTACPIGLPAPAARPDRHGECIRRDHRRP